jgi:hypothetical protein
MDTSILNTTKKILGLPAEDESFDLDVITAINSAFSTITDLGVGPEEGFVIEDDEAVWGDLDPTLSPVQLSQVKTYVYLSVRLIFDPPQTSFAIAALEKQLVEHQWRLNVRRETTEWVDPDPVVTIDE